MLTAARCGAHNAAGGAFEMHRLSHQALRTKTVGHHVLHHVQVLNLRFFKDLLHVIDVAAGYAIGVEALDPVIAVLTGQSRVDRRVERGVTPSRAT